MRHPNHGKEFWQLNQQLTPANVPHARRWLKQQAQSLYQIDWGGVSLEPEATSPATKPAEARKAPKAHRKQPTLSPDQYVLFEPSFAMDKENADAAS